MKRPAHNGFVNINITVPDFQIEATVRIGADPRFVVDSRPLRAKVRQGYQVSFGALAAFRKTILFHDVHLPAEVSQSIQ